MRLTVRSVVSSDSGEYHCTATPWYLSASTGAWTEAGELTSGRVFLTVKFAGEESVPFPVHTRLCSQQCKPTLNHSILLNRS